MKLSGRSLNILINVIMQFFRINFPRISRVLPGGGGGAIPTIWKPLFVHLKEMKVMTYKRNIEFIDYACLVSIRNVLSAIIII
jgi:hypothetical protein